MSSEEDYYGSDYEDEETHLYDEDSDDDEDYGLGSAVYDEELTFRPRQPRFSVLSEGDILQRQAEAVKDVSTVLSVDEMDAAILLRHFKWSVSQVNDEWFHNEEKVRHAVGLLSLDDTPPSTSSVTSNPKGLAASLAPSQSQRKEAPSLSPEEAADTRADEELTCGICFESFPTSALKPASCQQHFFCETCWKGYISTAIADGPGCLHMRCPDPECNAAVKERFVLSVARDDTALGAKYKKYLVRSYVDDNRNAKWCPAPGCEYAVEFFPDSSNYDVECKCGYKFCWNCNEEAHRPVDCETVARWILKNSAESENMNWILAHSKACPKCKRPIEKNLGCMHMTCTPPCKHEFCWLCLGAWSEHGEKTGGFYACNRYEAARHKGLYDEAERRKEMAQNSLEKYTHYYERWAANEQSRVKAMESLREMQSTKIEMLSERQSQPISQLKFVTEAWLQIVECRRILKWTYAYGYYLPWEDQAKKQFFEYLQGEADTALENLHRMAEKELALYIDGYNSEGEDPAKPERPFSEFKSHLAGLTSVTHTYFENLVRALENGLADVEAKELRHDQPQPGHPHQPSAPKKDKRPGGGPSAALSSSQGASASTSAAFGMMGGGAAGSSANTAAPSRSSGGGAMARLARVAVRGTRGQSGTGGMSSSGSASTSRAQTPGQAPSRTQGGQSSTQGLRARHSSPSRRQEESLSYWSCEHCTFANREGTHICSMCNLPRTATG